MLLGPSALIWERNTGYRSTMAGFPYDDLDGWRAHFPPAVFAEQFAKVSAGFHDGAERIRALSGAERGARRRELEREAGVAEACGLHFGAASRLTRFVSARRALEAGTGDRKALVSTLKSLLEEERGAARRLLELQSHDSRIGFEASNQYYYVDVDLAEKVLNCTDLLERWIPALETAG
ncbi:MAG: hypothetical protein ACKO5K_15695, partial [Armatimonadota bacterium]